MKSETPKVGDKILTQDGAAVVKVVDHIEQCVRVEHVDAKTPITDYRFSDLQFIK